MVQPWSVMAPATPTPELLAATALPPLAAQILVQRGLADPEAALAFLDPGQYHPSPPTALIGVERAAQLLHAALLAGSRILVWGDFDVDGQTSTSLLVSALRVLCSDNQVGYHIPNRFHGGHGIQVDQLRLLLDDPGRRPGLLLTCDTGIAEADAIGYAKDAGIKVVVTDHHDLTPEFAELDLTRVDPWHDDPGLVGRSSVRRADAIVNPKFQPPGDPLRSLPGVGVAYKLIQRLYELYDRAGAETEFLDLVALGIVADVAEQVHDTRYLLQRGLVQLRRTKRTGLLALMDVARVSPANVDAETIGFQLGPRMNALGRLEDATVAVDLLTTRDAIRAGQLAAKLERLNQQRRVLTSQITAAAMEMVDRKPELLDFNALVLAHPAWHAGIVGIVASHMAEEFNRPAVLLLTPPGEPARGSARSAAGVDIGAAIAGCSHLLIGHGGHPGAAGLTLLPENIDRFRRELDRQVELHRSEDSTTGLAVHAIVEPDAIDLNLVEQIQRLAPFGQGNPAPVFMSTNMEVVSDRRIGREGTHRRLEMKRPDTRSVLPVIWFNGADVELPAGPIDIAYNLTINEYRSERTVQLTYVDSRPARDVAARRATPSVSVQVHDLRAQTVQREELPQPAYAAWYAEGIHLDQNESGTTYFPRTAIGVLRHAPLVIWSIPPSARLLRWLCETVSPLEIYLCAHPTVDDSLGGVLRSVAGMCKFALAGNHRLDIARMAARIGTTETVIRYSLLWLEGQGHIHLSGWEGDDILVVAPGHGQISEDAAVFQADLEEQLAEVRAYRRYFRRAKVSELGISSIDD